MSEMALYLGGDCPPNMEAYVDSFLFRTRESGDAFDLVVTGGCSLPSWMRAADRVNVVRYGTDEGAGLDRLTTAASVVGRYVRANRPDVVRQVTQPRWHAPGVLLGTAGTDAAAWTRASASLFDEYREAPSPVRAWAVNNGLGRSVFLGETVFTPRYGGVSLPWWSRADLVREERVVNRERFRPDAAPRSGLFERSDHRVLTVGRVSRRKGTDLLLAVADRLPDYEFVVVGPVQDEALAAAVADAPNVSHHPPVEYAEMPGLYAAADVVLSVSRLEWGGISRAMLEGSASGRPVVALDEKEAADVADVAVTEDPDAIARAVASLADGD